MKLNPLFYKSPALVKYERALLKITKNFSGIEGVIENPAEMPFEAISEIIARCVESPAEQQEELLRALVSRFPLFEYHAAAANGDIWNPLSESLREFRARHRCKGKVTLWRDWGQYPTATEVEQWLDRWLES